jgi:hypothetical protein
MGLYAKAILLSHQQDKKKGLFQKALELHQKELLDSQKKPKTETDIITGLKNEINQQINICKANKLPLAIVQISLESTVTNVLKNNREQNIESLKKTLVAFLEKLLADESKLTQYDKDCYIFTIFNSDTVFPEMVLHQMSQSFYQYVEAITEATEINFNRKIRFFPEHGENAEHLLRSLK